MGCTSTIIKYVLFIFNIICVLFGIALVTVGVIFLKETAEPQLEDDTKDAVSITLIVLGSIIFIIAFFGCCGAISENVCMLHTYAVILLIMLVIELIIGIMAVACKKNVKMDINRKTDYTTTSGIIVIVIAVAKLVGPIFACILSNSIKKRSRRGGFA